MSYEFNEISFLKDEGADWWETIKQVPIKVLDQDFGVEVQMSDLIASNANGKTKDPIAPSQAQQGIPESESRKVLDLDSFKLKEDIDKKEGYSKVSFDKDYFKVEIFSTQFEEQDFNKAMIEKGFLVITARGKQMEGDATVWRQFKRRYMLPHDCNVSDVMKQVIVEKIEGGMSIKVVKNVEDRKSPQKHSPLKSPTSILGRKSTSPIKSSPKASEGMSPSKVKEGMSTLVGSPTKMTKLYDLLTSPIKAKGASTIIGSPTRVKEGMPTVLSSPTRVKEGMPTVLSSPTRVKEGMSTLKSSKEKQGKSPSPLRSPPKDPKDKEASQEKS